MAGVTQYGAVRDYLARKFGGQLIERDGTLATDATVKKVIGGNPDRFSVTIVNLGGNAVYLGMDQQVSATHGIYLAPNGGTLSMIADEDMTLPTREWWATSPAGASTIYSLRVSIYALNP